MLLSKPSLLAGFAFGSRYPSLYFELQGGDADLKSLEEMSRSYLEMLGIDASAHEIARPDGEAPADWFLRQIAIINAASGLPVHDSPKAIRRDDDIVYCIAPTLNSIADSMRALIVGFANHLRLSASDPERNRLAKAMKLHFGKLTGHANGRTNPHRLMSAAWEKDIPFMEVSDRFTQYGLGRNGICLDSTLHERESGLGVSSSRDKATSASILRRIGLPAMHHTFARNADHAVQIARQLKYPVVVKPSSLDGGLGVEADLRSDEEVRQAFAKALKYTPKILVEKWVPGRDYRMVVLNNKLVWAVERVPGGVTGDGRSTIAELVEIENRDPNRGPSPDLPMNLLEIDDEATLVLEREGLTTQSVPQAGAFVRLRRAANVSRGGRPVAVFDKVHPDNAALAVEAANAMWLDLAGVDLILPDITKSWRETGGVVCEVNSQPQLGGLTSAHLFPLVLETFTRNRGAIPVCCVAGADRASALSEMIAGQLSARGAQVGLNLPDTIKVGSDRIREGSVPILQAGNILSWRRTIDAMVLGVWDTSVLQTGLPVPALDLLVLSGENIPTVDDLISHMLPMLAPSARKVVVVATPDDCDPEILKVLKTEGIAHSFVTQDDLLSLVRNISDSYPQTPEAGAALQ